MNHQILVFSGLGADERVFQHIDWGQNEVVYVHWIEPFGNEPIEAYARRLVAPYQIRNPILVGLSFGGIVATEVSRLIPFQRIILLSSVKHRREIPWYMRLAGTFGIHHLIPKRILKGAGSIPYWAFGLKTANEKALLDGFLAQSSDTYLRWAIGRVLRWKNTVIPQTILHIHGESDRIFPIGYVHADKVIPQGGHFMVYDHAKEVNIILRDYL